MAGENDIPRSVPAEPSPSPLVREGPGSQQKDQIAASSPKADPPPHLFPDEVSVTGPWAWLQRAGDARFRVVSVRVRVPGWRVPGYRIAFVTDLHLRRKWEPVLDPLLEVLRRERTELVVFGGDWVEDKKDHRSALPFARRLIDELARLAPDGVWSVTGNHDGPMLERNLAGSPVRWLMGRRETVPVRDGAGVVELIGLAGHKASQVDPSVWYQPGKPPGALRVVVTHFPHLARRAMSMGADLYLAGHTHGGQVCMPWRGRAGWEGRVLLSHDMLPKRYASGMHAWGSGRLVVSRGMGFSNWQVRVACPPEVWVIEVVGEDGGG